MTCQDKAERYAGALFDLNKEESTQQKTADQLKQIVALFNALPAFQKFLFAPVFPKKQKKELLLSLLKPFDAQHLLPLLGLLLERGNIAYLPEIADCYDSCFLEKKGVIKVDLETALPLSLEAENHLRDSLKKRLGKNVILEQKISPSLMGGARLSLLGRSLNDSIKDRLSYLKQRFAHEF